MADRIKGITIELNGDATGLDKALKGVNKELNATQGELNDVNRLLKFNPQNLELLTQKQKLLTKQIDATKDKLKTLKEAANQAAKQLERGEITQKQYDALQREIVETESKLKHLEGQAKETNETLAQASKKFDGKELAQKFATAGKAIGAAVGAMALALGAGIKKFVDLAKQTSEAGDNIDKMSQKIGMSAEAYQKWDFILEQNGANIESLKAPMKTLATQAQKNSAAFQKLGISQEEVASLSQEDLFAKTIEGLQKMGEGTERTALASQLLGKGATELGPLLNASAEETAALAEQAEKYGFIMSDAAVKASAAFDDSLNVLSKTMEGLKNRMMAEFLPALTDVTDGLALIFTGDEAGAEKVAEGIDGLISKLTEMTPKVMTIGGTIIEGLATSIIDNLEPLLNAALNVVVNLANYIIENLPYILRVAVNIIKTLAEGIIKALPDLIPALVDVILEMVDYLTSPETMEMLIDVGVELIVAVGIGLMRALPKLLMKLPDIIGNIALSFINLIPMLIDSIKNSLGNNMSKIVEAAKGWGKDMLDGIVQGILNNIAKVANAAKAVGEKIKSFLHFSRPDEGPLRDYETWMPDFINGLTRTLNDSKYKLTNAVSNMASEMSVNMVAPSNISNMLGQYLPYLADRQQIVLDTGALVGETAPMYNKAIGRMVRQGL